MYVQAIIIDGFYKGYSEFIKYQPVIRLIKSGTMETDFCPGNTDFCSKNTNFSYDEYIECFRSVDRKIILYSTKGQSDDFMKIFKNIIIK